MRYYDYSPMYHHSFFWQGGFLSILLNLLIWGIIIYLIVYLVRKLFASQKSCCEGSCCGGNCCSDETGMTEKSNEYYLDIAKERYAKGEIDKKHYEELKHEFAPSRREELKEELEEEKGKE